MIDNLEYDRIYGLDYQQMRQALIDTKEVDVDNIIIEAMVGKYYQDYSKQIWSQIEMRLFSVRADIRFTAVACLSRCNKHVEQAIFLATHLVNSDTDKDVREAAQAFIDAQKQARK